MFVIFNPDLALAAMETALSNESNTSLTLLINILGLCFRESLVTLILL